MKRMTPAAIPDAYVEALDGWRREIVESLRTAVRAASAMDEVVKWGHLVYLENGPVLLIRAEESRVLFGFWRGQRLTAIEPRLKAGGKYEMATLELRDGMTIDSATARSRPRVGVVPGAHGVPREPADGSRSHLPSLSSRHNQNKGAACRLDDDLLRDTLPPIRTRSF